LILKLYGSVTRSCSAPQKTLLTSQRAIGTPLSFCAIVSGHFDAPRYKEGSILVARGFHETPDPTINCPFISGALLLDDAFFKGRCHPPNCQSNAKGVPRRIEKTRKRATASAVGDFSTDRRRTDPTIGHKFAPSLREQSWIPCRSPIPGLPENVRADRGGLCRLYRPGA